MTSLSERQKMVQWINEAMESGARKHKACEVAHISIRTLQRWWTNDEIVEDLRPSAIRPVPKNKLSDAERRAVIDICSVEEFASSPPSQIVPRLADRGTYLASESTFYRILKADGLLHHRGRDKPKGSLKKPTSYTANLPNEVWSWDISYMTSLVRGQFYYLYMIEDIYSRKIVGWEVNSVESGDLAADLLQRTVLIEKYIGEDLVLHSDNGSPMKCLTMQTKMNDLGVLASRSRPGVSNDNPYIESLFRTVKYCPRWPSEGFKSLEHARQWVQEFVQWYNHEHRHSRINFVTPDQRHRGEDELILAKRQELYELKKSANPERWQGATRNWNPVGPVQLNPENVSKTEEIKKAA
jgi:putative transposase